LHHAKALLPLILIMTNYTKFGKQTNQPTLRRPSFRLISIAFEKPQKVKNEPCQKSRRLKRGGLAESGKTPINNSASALSRRLTYVEEIYRSLLSDESISGAVASR
jgi:hypothetical protein